MKRIALVCIFALLAACAALHGKPEGFREERTVGRDEMDGRAGVLRGVRPMNENEKLVKAARAALIILEAMADASPSAEIVARGVIVELRKALDEEKARARQAQA
jgi:hypothetical protein